LSLSSNVSGRARILPPQADDELPFPRRQFGRDQTVAHLHAFGIVFGEVHLRHPPQELV
jgi:hypothetical protein